MSAALCTIGLVAAISFSTSTPSVAGTPPAPTRNVGLAPCDNVPADLAGYQPGDLLAAQPLTLDKKLITEARAWRILYVSIGADESQLQAVCGVVVAPKDPSDVKREVVAWSHGTVGIHQACQPSMDPNAYIFGPTPQGIGAVEYGGKVATGGTSGKAKNGIVQGLIDSGRLVTATDYSSGLGQEPDSVQHYALGVPSGANVLDSARAGIELIKLQDSGADAGTWKMVTWGHSQGGHSAIWAGQLAHDYLASTRDGNDPKLSLVGVAAEAPASSFVASKNTPPDLIGRHMGDLEMHQDINVLYGLTKAAAGPLLFSFVVTAWDQFGQQSPNPGAQFPGSPAGPRPDALSMLTGPDNAPSDKNGLNSSETITANCLLPGLGASTAGLATRPYTKPARNAFFVQPIWGEKVDDTFRGELDSTCLSVKPESAIGVWCTWLRYNDPGPRGKNPFDKVPSNSTGKKVPIYIAQGAQDTVIHCVNDTSSVPSARNCLARQLYNSYDDVCKNNHVELDVWRKHGGSVVRRKSPATHLSIAGQAADNGKASFDGSRLDKFIDRSFARTHRDGCSAEVVN